MLNKLVSLINENVSGANATALTPELGDSSIEVSSTHIKAVIECLKSNSSLGFNALHVISGLDYPEYFEVNYMLCNYDSENKRNVMIKTKLNNKNNPSLESVSDVYSAANFQEREVFDMFGITFDNHPDPRRILCPDDWEGFPLRKDYEVQQVYNGMIVNPAHKINTDDMEFAARQKAIKKAQTEQAGS